MQGKVGLQPADRIVGVALDSIAEDVVRLRDLLVPLSCLGLGVLVRVKGQGEPPVGRLDLGQRGFRKQLQPV
eukprot:3793766-Alexandrium_andersonii.AAC.1